MTHKHIIEIRTSLFSPEVLEMFLLRASYYSLKENTLLCYEEELKSFKADLKGLKSRHERDLFMAGCSNAEIRSFIEYIKSPVKKKRMTTEQVRKVLGLNKPNETQVNTN